MKIGLGNYKEVLGEDPSEEVLDRATRYHTLSLDLISKFKHKINWYFVCEYQLLTENFMIKHHKYLHWRQCVLYQILTEKFIDMFRENMYSRDLTDYQVISEVLHKKYGIERKILTKVRYRILYSVYLMRIEMNTPHIIHIFDFTGTREQAIQHVKDEYFGADVVSLMINDCFDKVKLPSDIFQILK